MLIIFYIIAYTYAYTSAKRNGHPFQYSCLESPMDRGVWQATVHGVTRGRHDLDIKLLLLCLYLPLSKLLIFIQSRCVLFKLYFSIPLLGFIFLYSWPRFKSGRYNSTINKEQNFVICRNMDGLGRHYSELNKSNKKTQMLYDIT